jgi:hypothetical protein
MVVPTQAAPRLNKTMAARRREAVKEKEKMPWFMVRLDSLQHS